ncbi:MAG: hypothetical protein AAGB03_11025, partial [Pseudomonadota bacterium]
RYNTSKGVIGIDEYNRLAREKRLDDPSMKYRLYCEQWLKHNAHTRLADEMYKEEQQRSRRLAGKGAGLSREDIDAIRKGA